MGATATMRTACLPDARATPVTPSPKGERSLLVFLALLWGLFVLFFALGEGIGDHLSRPSHGELKVNPTGGQPLSESSARITDTGGGVNADSEEIHKTGVVSPERATVPGLAEFMAQWRNNPPFLYPTNPADIPLLLAALEQEPTGPWEGYLAYRFIEDSSQARKLPPPERKAKFAEILKYLVPARDSVARASSRQPADKEFKERLQSCRQQVAEASLEAGSSLESVAAQARELLAANLDTNSWNYGNVIYQANDLLGRIAMRRGRIEEANAYLLAAGKSPGSPQLNSFGPLDLSLARGLLEKGQRDVVLEFLDSVGRFWANPEARVGPNNKQVATNNRRQLESWKEQIGQGKVPDDPRWRR